MKISSKIIGLLIVVVFITIFARVYRPEKEGPSPSCTDNTKYMFLNSSISENQDFLDILAPYGMTLPDHGSLKIRMSEKFEIIEYSSWKSDGENKPLCRLLIHVSVKKRCVECNAGRFVKGSVVEVVSKDSDSIDTCRFFRKGSCPEKPEVLQESSIPKLPPKARIQSYSCGGKWCYTSSEPPEPKYGVARSQSSWNSSSILFSSSLASSQVLSSSKSMVARPNRRTNLNCRNSTIGCSSSSQ